MYGRYDPPSNPYPQPDMGQLLQQAQRVPSDGYYPGTGYYQQRGPSFYPQPQQPPQQLAPDVDTAFIVRLLLLVIGIGAGLGVFILVLVYWQLVLIGLAIIFVIAVLAAIGSNS